jgi:hypothetical protein
MMRRIPGENSKLFFQVERVKTHHDSTRPHFHSFVKIQDTKKGRKRRGKSNVKHARLYFKTKGGKRI